MIKSIVYGNGARFQTALDYESPHQSGWHFGALVTTESWTLWRPSLAGQIGWSGLGNQQRIRVGLRGYWGRNESSKLEQLSDQYLGIQINYVSRTPIAFTGSR